MDFDRTVERTRSWPSAHASDLLYTARVAAPLSHPTPRRCLREGRLPITPQRSMSLIIPKEFVSWLLATPTRLTSTIA